MFWYTYISCESFYVRLRKPLKSSRTPLNAARDDSFQIQTYVYRWKVEIKSFTLMYVNPNHHALVKGHLEGNLLVRVLRTYDYFTIT